MRCGKDEVKTMTLLFKTTLALTLLLLSSLLRTTNEVAATARPNCDQSRRRTISLRVENKAGASIANLCAEDLSLFEDDASREIFQLESKMNEPVSVAILIDKSMSQELVLPQMKLAAQAFSDSILLGNKDRVALVSFTGEVTLEENLTDDLAKVQAAISRVKFVPPAGYLGNGVIVGRMPPPKPPVLGSTAIWDAVWESTDRILHAAPDSRRAIVLFTDGEDTSSSRKLHEAIEYAARYDVAVFSIGVADQQSYGPANHDSLKKLSDQTGGHAFFPKKSDELTEIIRQINQELRSHYLLTYCASNATAISKPSKIKVQLANPKSQDSARLSYRRYGF